MSTFKKMKLVNVSDKATDEKPNHNFEEVNKLMTHIIESNENKKDTIKKFKKFIKTLENRETDQKIVKVSRKLLTPPSKKKKDDSNGREQFKWVKL